MKFVLFIYRHGELIMKSCILSTYEMTELFQDFSVSADLDLFVYEVDSRGILLHDYTSDFLSD